PRHDVHEVVEEVLFDELHRALGGHPARHVVRALAQRRHRVGHRHRALAHRQERVIVLGVADADHVVRRQLERRQRRRQPGALGDAARQQHERALVEDERALDAGLLDGGQRGLRERRLGRQDRAPDRKDDAAALERGDQRGLGRVAQRAHLAPLGEVDERAVLGDHRVEHPLELGTDRLQVGQHASGDEEQLATGGAHAFERARGGLADAVTLGARSVVVGGEDVDVHGASLVPRYHGRGRRLPLGPAQARRSSAYTAVVRIMAASSEWRSRTRTWPRWAIARAPARSLSETAMAAARAATSPAGTSRPVCPSRTSSPLPPTSVATTGVPTASAWAMTCEAASERIEGSTSTSSAAMTSGMSRRNPVMRTAASRPSVPTRRRTSSNPMPSPTIRKRAVGSCASTAPAASRKMSWPLEPRMLATSPTSGAAPSPSSARTPPPDTAGWKRAVSTPGGMGTIRAAGTPAAATTRAAASPLLMMRSAR